MEIRLRRLAMLFLTTALLVVLVTSAYGAFSAEKAPAEKKGKNLKQTVGKNWEIEGGVIESSGKKAQPPKDYEDTVTPSEAKAMIEQRSMPSGEALEPRMDTDLKGGVNDE